MANISVIPELLNVKQKPAQSSISSLSAHLHTTEMKRFTSKISIRLIYRFKNRSNKESITNKVKGENQNLKYDSDFDNEEEEK